MRVLFMAHDYPPVGGGGVQRLLHFVRALDAAGHAVSVVAVDKDGGSMRDTSLLDRHPPSVPITRYRLPSVEPLVGFFRRAHMSRLPWLVLPPDLYVDASLFAGATARAALAVARDFKPEVVVASGPPFGIFEGARRAAAEMNLPLVLDMRDPWVDPLTTRLPSIVAYRWARDLQRRCLSAADLTVVTAPTLQKLLEGLSAGRPRRIVTITNGFDGSAPATEAARLKGRALVRMDGVRTIAFVGRLFATEAPARSPARKWADQAFDLLAVGPELVRTNDYHPGAWFEALAILAARRRDLWGKLRTVFIGDIPAQARGFEHLGGAFPVVRHGYQSFQVAAEAMRAADGLLLLNLSTSDDSPSFTIHGKLFEYLAAGPPIFAMSGPGDCPEIIRRTGTGVWTHDRRPADMADQLEGWLDGRPLPITRDEGAIAAYDRDALGRRLVSEIERVVAERRPPNA